MTNVPPQCRCALSASNRQSFGKPRDEAIATTRCDWDTAVKEAIEMNTDKSKTNDTNREAIKLLAAPDFFQHLLHTMQQGGLVGEERNSQALYTVATSSVLPRPLNAMVKGKSSAGKNHLTNQVLRLFPKTAVREITSSSKTARNYGQDDFRNRIVYLQERNDAAGAIHPVRLLISEGKLKRIVTVRENGEWATKTFVANGPIAAISTTTRDRIENDDETRHVSLWVDESHEQNRRIIRSYLSTQSAEKAEDVEVWRQAHRLVRERAAATKIVLPPWFSRIGDLVYDGSITVRRYLPAFVEVCRTLALLRSFQKSGDVATPPAQIAVDFVDYSVATILFDGVFVESLHRTADKNLPTRLAVEEISKAKNGAGVSASELARHMKISEDRAYARLRSAGEAGIVERANEAQRGNLKLYRTVDLPRIVPDPQTLFSQIDEIPGPVEFIHPLTGHLVKLSRSARKIKSVREEE
jgi:DNA-binding transcriptional ArsR family regulator